MNKTSLLLDVTRTYQVTDSAFELRGDTVQEDETEKMNFLLCIFSFFGYEARYLREREGIYTGLGATHGRHEGD